MSKFLHMGSGTWYYDYPNWVNVDVCDPDPGCRKPDVYASIFELPFEPETFSRIYLGHVLEHLQPEEIPAAFAELRRVSTADCEVGIVGPAYDLAVEQHEPDWLLEAIQAHGDPPGGHAWTATVQGTLDAVLDAGLVAERVDIGSIARPYWPNPNHTAAWQVAILAHWPALSSS